MTWNKSQLIPPAEPLGDQLADVGNTITSDNAGKSNALSGVSGFLPIPPAQDVSPQGMREQLTTLLQQGGRYICVHPYQYRVGTLHGDHSYLSPAQACSVLADKLADPRAGFAEQPYELAAAMITADNGEEFSDALRVLCKVFPAAELQLAERRAKALSTLEQDKFVTPAAPFAPPVLDADPRRHGLADTTYSPLLGQLESYADEHMRPEDELTALIQKRAAAAEEHTAAMQEFQALFASASAYTFSASGSPAALRSALAKSGPPAETNKYTAMFAVIGQDIAFYKEIFQC